MDEYSAGSPVGAWWLVYPVSLGVFVSRLWMPPTYVKQSYT